MSDTQPAYRTITYGQLYDGILNALAAPHGPIEISTADGRSFGVRTGRPGDRERKYWPCLGGARFGGLDLTVGRLWDEILGVTEADKIGSVTISHRHLDGLIEIKAHPPQPGSPSTVWVWRGRTDEIFWTGEPKPCVPVDCPPLEEHEIHGFTDAGSGKFIRLEGGDFQTSHPGAFAAPASPMYDFLRNPISFMLDFNPPTDEERIASLTEALNSRRALEKAARHAGLIKDYNRLMHKLERTLGEILVRRHLEQEITPS